MMDVSAQFHLFVGNRLIMSLHKQMYLLPFKYFKQISLDKL